MINHSRIVAAMTKRRMMLIVAVSAAILFGVVVYAATPTTLGIGTVSHSDIAGGPATMTARKNSQFPPEKSGAGTTIRALSRRSLRAV